MDERIRMERFQFLAVGQCSKHATYNYACGNKLSASYAHPSILLP